MTSEVLADPEGGHRARLRAFVESERFRNPVLALIAVNAAILGLQTSPSVMAATGSLLVSLDHGILGLFVAELALRIYAHGWRFFRDPWGVFDFVIVGIALVPASESMSALRALRILRALRLVSGVPSMRRVVEALLHSVPGIGSIGALLLLVFYVFAVIATNLYGARFPDLFGTVGASMYSLFQVMTLESWSMDVVRPIMAVYPYAWTFFVPFIVISSFTVLNLFIAIIVDSMQTLHKSEEAKTVKAITHTVHDESGVVSGEIAALREEIRSLRLLLEERSR